MQGRIIRLIVSVLAVLCQAQAAPSGGNPESPGILQRSAPDILSAAFHDRLIWGDVVVRGGWRVQQEGLSGRCRILDARENALASGDCSDLLREFETAHSLRGEGNGVLAILVHGYNGTRTDLSPIAEKLASLGIRSETVSLPTFIADIGEQARWLNAALEKMDGSGPILFIAHSMGGRAVLRAVAEQPPWMARRGSTGALFIGTPFKGVTLARLAADFGVVGLGGPAARELASEMNGLTPSIPSCVIARGNGQHGWNPVIPGDDDGVIAVAETDMGSTADRILVHDWHKGLLRHPDTFAAIASFVQTGRCSHER